MSLKNAPYTYILTNCDIKCRISLRVDISAFRTVVNQRDRRGKMQIIELLARAMKWAIFVFSISACYLKIRFFGIAKVIIFKMWLFGTSFKAYGKSHANELIYQLIVTVVGGIVAGYIAARLAR